jgi:hypothetical protein
LLVGVGARLGRIRAVREGGAELVVVFEQPAQQQATRVLHGHAVLVGVLLGEDIGDVVHVLWMQLAVVLVAIQRRDGTAASAGGRIGIQLRVVTGS